MLTLFAFLFALTLLVAVHELGHYLAARSCGIRVLRFSIGFGRPLLRWRRGADDTEFVVAAVPLGGYVRMLDEREGPVPAAQLHRAFNRQGPWARAWVVIAGPAANLLLAVLLFGIVSMVGVREPLPLLGQPPAGSAAAAAGVHAGQQVLATTLDGRMQALQSWPQLLERAQRAAQTGQGLELLVEDAQGQRRLALAPQAVRAGEVKPQASAQAQAWGLRLQAAPLRIAKVLADSAAAQAGLRAGDVVLAAQLPEPPAAAQGAGQAAPQSLPSQPGAAVDPAQLLQLIAGSRGQPLRLQLRRGAATLELQLRPRRELDAQGVAHWRIGALLDASPPTTLVRLGPLQALQQGVRRTWELSALSLRALGGMIVGRTSLDQLSGPVTIADYAGKTAALGWLPYVNFLAVVSLSLGVLNLLPIPVLDGGHLLYYAVEILTRRKVPQRVQERLQQVGLALVALMIAVALYNDIARVLGSFH